MDEDAAAFKSPYVPEEWKDPEKDMPPQARKVRVTLLLDEPVARFYRARGQGYQAFIAEVPKPFAQLRLAKGIEWIEDRGVNGSPI